MNIIILKCGTGQDTKTASTVNISDNGYSAASDPETIKFMFVFNPTPCLF